MKDYRSLALTQAAMLVGRAAKVTVPQNCRLMDGCCGSPEAFALAARQSRSPELVAAELMEQVELADSWFDRVTSEGGYLNLRLSDLWYTAVATAPIERGAVYPVAVPPMPAFPAVIQPGDWRFLCRSEKAQVTPMLAARQDQGNAAWLVRYTGQRLAELAARQGGMSPRHWKEQDRRVLLNVSEYPSRRSAEPMVLRRHLTQLARLVWKSDTLSPVTQRACAQVLTAGYHQLAGDCFTKNSPSKY